MKNIISTIKKIFKILVTVAIIGLVLYAGYVIYSKQNTVTVENIAEQEASEYQERVEAKMEETADDWKEKHKVWAEQEVSREIIAEQEAKLETLREKELSL